MAKRIFYNNDKEKITTAEASKNSLINNKTNSSENENNNKNNI